MSLIGDLEFKTIIEDKPVIIKMSNACLTNIEFLSEDGCRGSIFTIKKIEIENEEEKGFLIEIIKDEEE